jgi:twitching motility protein PilT
VPALLQAVVNIDGEALVMHAGDKPYVVAPSGQVELASRGLTLEAVTGIVAQLLPIEFQNALDEFGAVQYTLPLQTEFPHEQFTVVVARGGDDMWAEIRRRRVPDDDMIPEELFEAAPTVSAVGPASTPLSQFAVDDDIVESPSTLHPTVGRVTMATSRFAAENGIAESPSALQQPTVDDGLAMYPVETELSPGGAQLDVDVELDDSVEIELTLPHEEPAISHVDEEPAARVVPPVQLTPPATPTEVAPPAPPVPEPEPVVWQAPPSPPPPAPPVPEPEPVVWQAPPSRPPPTPPVPEPEPVWQEPVIPPPSPRPAPPVWQAPPPHVSPQPGVVLQMSRNSIRVEPPPPRPPDDTLSGLERLLRTAASRGASTLYLSSDARPSVRVDGELQSLDGEPVHTASDVISLLLTLMPDRSHEALRTGATTEWINDIEDIGRVRCMSFRDHRGPGGVFRLMPVRTVSVDQLGLPREVQSLASEPAGLVLISGSRSSGKRTILSSLVDLINRTRRDHVITIEREVNIVHERGSSFISQREVRGGDDEVLAAARAALREDPDVLVLEQIRTGLLMNVALEAAASGHLVIGGFSAHDATESIDRIIDLYAPEYARLVQLALADNLRGVVAQVLLPKISGGGRVAAREVLLNTPAVAGLIAEGKTSQLPMAIEAGRRLGMVPLNDALVAYVQSGIVDVRDAYRHVSDRPAFLALLKRKGVDTSAFERLA